jgi:hypothetical protein
MKKTQYRTHLKSVKGNGLLYTLNHTPNADKDILQKIHAMQMTVDFLQWRQEWFANPLDTSKKNIIKLTSTI